jgi:hypothetical protein
LKILYFTVHGPGFPHFFEGAPEGEIGHWNSGPGLMINIILAMP